MTLCMVEQVNELACENLVLLLRRHSLELAQLLVDMQNPGGRFRKLPWEDRAKGREGIAEDVHTRRILIRNGRPLLAVVGGASGRERSNRHGVVIARNAEHLKGGHAGSGGAGGRRTTCP